MSIHPVLLYLIRIPLVSASYPAVSYSRIP
jgi:hypothetical protein